MTKDITITACTIFKSKLTYSYCSSAVKEKIGNSPATKAGTPKRGGTISAKIVFAGRSGLSTENPNKPPDIERLV